MKVVIGINVPFSLENLLYRRYLIKPAMFEF